MLRGKFRHTSPHLHVMRDGLVAAICKFGGALLAYLMMGAIARAMETEEFGQFAFAYSWATLGAVVFGIGQPLALVRHWSLPARRGQPSADTDAGEENALDLSSLFTLLGIAAGIAMTGAIALVLRASNASYGLSDMLAASLFLAAFTLSEFMSAGLRAQGRLAAALLPREILWRLLAIATTAVAIQLAMPVRADVVLWVLSALLLLASLHQVASLDLARTRLRETWRNRPAMRNWWHNSKHFWASTAVGALAPQAGVVIIGFLLSPVTAGLFFAADRIGRMLALPLIATQLASMPTLARQFAAGESAQAERTGAMMSLAATALNVIGLAIAVIGGGMLLKLFGSEYEAAYLPLVVLALGHLFASFAAPAIFALQMAGHEDRYFRYLVIGTVVSLILQVLLTIGWGPVGTAWGITIGRTLWSGLSLYGCARHLKISPTFLTLLGRGRQGTD